MKIASFRRSAQSGFTLIELMVVAVILAVLAALVLPGFFERKYESTAPEVGKAVQASITKLVRNREGGGGWTTASNAELASILEVDGRVVVDKTANKIYHQLGDASGLISFDTGTVVASNDAGRFTMDKVNGAACPALAASVKNFAATIDVNGTSIKSFGGEYKGPVAQTACVKGNTNTLTVQFM